MNSRLARIADEQEVRRVLAEARLDLVDMVFNDIRFIVADDDRSGRIVGTVGLELYPPDALLRSLAVSPAARGGGLGSLLVHDAIREASRAGCSRIVLLTLDAMDFFARFGFEPVDRISVEGDVANSPQFAGHCPESATAMSMQLHGMTP